MSTTVLAGLAVTSHNNSFLNQATFDNVTIVTQAPSIALTSPQPNTTLNNPTSINLSAAVTVGANPVSRVEFLVDGVLIGQTTQQPYNFTWTSPLYGTRELTAQAVDSLGQIGVSSPILITLNVNNTPGFRAEYYDNLDFTDLVMVRADPKIDFNWGEGSPDPRIDSNSYSIRWSGYLSPPTSGLYDLTAETDDGVRVWLNGQLIIDQWVNQGPTRSSATVSLTAGGSNHIVMEYFESGGGATARLFWKSATGDEEIIPSNRVIVPPVNAPPLVSLNAPLAGSSSLTTDTLTFSAAATDSDGTIARVEFWADGEKLGERTAPPYEWSWPGPHNPGPHSLWAIAVDNNGAATPTLPIQIQSLPFSLEAVGIQTTIEPPAMTFTVRTTLPTGRNYIIEWSADLTDWTPLQSGTSTGAVIEAIQETTGIGQRFYRLHVAD